MANEKRLIWADALKQMFDEREADDVELYGGVHVIECFPADDAKEIVDRAPTVEAVEVVRCRDCKHYNKDALWCNINSAQFAESHYNWYAEDFCSYGARMDGDVNG